MAQGTTSQAASSTENQEPAGGKPSSTWRTQGEGHDTPDSDSGDAQGGDNEGGDNEAPPVCPDAPGAPGGGGGNGGKGRHIKGKLIGKQPAKKRRKGTPKKKTVTPAIPLVKKTDQPRLGGLQYQGPCLRAGQRYPPINRTLIPLRVVKARKFKPDGRIEIVDWTERTSHGLSQRQNGRTAGASPEVLSRNDGFKGNLTLPKVHGISHQKASVPEVSQGDRS